MIVCHLDQAYKSSQETLTIDILMIEGLCSACKEHLPINFPPK